MKPAHNKKFPDKRDIPRGREKLLCRHCDDTIRRDAYCEACKKFLDDQCCACHDEVEHGQIKMQNTNTLGGRKMQRHGQGKLKRHTIETRRRGGR